MWPFRKKVNDIATLGTIKDEWSVSTGMVDADQLIVRRNTAARSWVGHPDLQIKLAFAIPAKESSSVENVTPEENLRLNEIEDTIVSMVAARCTGIHVLTITNKMMKEIVFYISAGADLEQLHHDIEAVVTTHKVQCIGELEQNWETYKFFGE